MNFSMRNSVATYAVLGAGLSSLLSGAGTLAHRRRKRPAVMKTDVFFFEDQFGYPTGEGESPDFDQQLIRVIRNLRSNKRKGLW